MLPVVYKNGHGFDPAFYQALQEEASYFGIEPLHKWIKERRYMQAVTIKYSVEEVNGQGTNMNDYDATVDGNTERSYHPSWGTEKVYQCPRDIFAHHGNPSACGRACEKAKGEEGDEYVERDILRTLIVSKRLIFNGMGYVGKLAQP